MIGRPTLAPGTAGVLYALGLFSAVKAAAAVLIAGAVASMIGLLADGRGIQAGTIAAGAGGFLLRAGAVWALSIASQRASAGAKELLRLQLAQRLVHDGGRSPLGEGEATVLASSGLDALDKYYTQFLPAVVGCAVVPLLVGLRIAAADWVSALIILLTIPLIPVFMALIGWHTQEKVADAAAQLGRLSNQLVELARGLPVLVGLGRAQAQTDALRRLSEGYRTTTMSTLRVAFLSALALELIATLSVAVVAVFIGLRLVGGDLDLETGLLVLILAPECYLSLRELGTAHHASDDGRVALASARTVLDAPAPTEIRRAPAPTSDRAPAVTIADLTVHYPGRTLPAVDRLTAAIPAGSIAALEGPSGSGKSTALAVLAGLVEPVSGTVTGVDPQRLAYVSQHPATVADTVEQEVALYGNGRIPPTRYLAAVGLAPVAGAHPGSLSPGELRRLAVARALARIDAGATLLLLDEPTAHLDGAAARQVEKLITGVRGRATILLTSHRPETRALASIHIPLTPAVEARQRTAIFAATEPTAAVEPRPDPHDHQARGSAVSSGRRPAERQPAAGLSAERQPAAGLSAERQPAASRLSSLALLRMLNPLSTRFLGAIAASALSTVAALALAALSGWLIVRASQQPPILYLLVAIVGVRFLGLLRATARYVERVVLHDAVFAALTATRIRLWEGLSRRALTQRSLLRGDTAVETLIRHPDAIRDLVPRVLVPPLAGLLSAATVLVAAGLAVPVNLRPAVLVIEGLVLAAGLLLAPAVGLLADRQSAVAEQRFRSAVTRQLARIVQAAADLRANRVEEQLLSEVASADQQATAALRRVATAQGLAQAVLSLSTGAGALALLLVAAPAVAAGTLPLENLAGLVLLQLALPDALGPVSAAVQQWPALKRALLLCAPLLEPGRGMSTPAVGAMTSSHPGVGSGVAGPGVLGSGMPALRLDGVTAGWPGAPTPVLRGLSTALSPGEWLTVTGPSGAGKTTLLAVLLGFLPISAGTLQRRGSLAWCPQQGHLFDSTLRANLLISRPRDQAPEDAELLAALGRVGLGPLLAELPDGLDTRLGPSGASFSGGQRQRIAVARTLLAGADTILLDEPTAHLDAEAAQALLADLRTGLGDRAVVLVTHDADAVRTTDSTLVLA